MPYSDEVHKGRYEDYLAQEVIPYIDAHFPTIPGREGHYIGGISAGGYNALHVAFRHPEMFARVGGHMPAIDLSYEEEDECYFADEAMWLKYDPITIAESAEPRTLDHLQVYLDDGDKDEGKFYRACEKLEKILKTKGVDVQYHLNEGCHNGEYILRYLREYLVYYGE